MLSDNIPSVTFRKKLGSDLEVEVIALEDFFARKKTIHLLRRPYRVRFHNILYITSGNGTHYIDFEPYDFSPGSLLFISQEQVQVFDAKPDVSGYLLLFTNEYLEKNLIHSELLSLYRLYNYHLHIPVLSANETVAESFEAIFKELKREYDHPLSFGKEEILRLLIKTMLLKAERIKSSLVGDIKISDWLIKFSKFKELLQKRFSEDRSVKTYAGELKISSKHLNTICKSVSGMTAKQFIDNATVLEIKRVLVTSDTSIQEICYACGFDEPTNFVKYFKKHTGQSPSQFRKKYTSEKQDYHLR